MPLTKEEIRKAYFESSTSSSKKLKKMLIVVIMVAAVAAVLILMPELYLGIFSNENGGGDGTTVRSVTIESATGNEIIIKNTGSGTIRNDELAVYVDYVPKTCEWNANDVGPGETILCILPDVCSYKILKVEGPANHHSVICE